DPVLPKRQSPALSVQPASAIRPSKFPQPPLGLIEQPARAFQPLFPRLACRLPRQRVNRQCLTSQRLTLASLLSHHNQFREGPPRLDKIPRTPSRHRVRGAREQLFQPSWLNRRCREFAAHRRTPLSISASLHDQ